MLDDERFDAPELMLDPSLIGREQPGFHLALQNSVQMCDVDLRTSLYGNIILAGR